MVDTLRIAIRKFGPFERAINKQFADFKANSGSKYELECESLDLNPLVESLFAKRGLKDGTWDVALMVTDWLADAVGDNCLIDLTPFMNTDPIDNYPGGWAMPLTRFQQFGRGIYGIPYHDGPECLVYRKDWFSDPVEQSAFIDQFGYSLAIPQTWSQFEDIARFFTRPVENRYGTIFAAFPDGHNTVYDFCIQLWSRGGELITPEASVTLDTPQAAAALDFYRRMVNDRGVTPPGLGAVDSVKSGKLFASGSIAMMVNWFGFAAMCEQPDSLIKGRVGVAPVPTGENGARASLNVYWLLSVAAGSRHKDEAYRFIRHCATQAMDKLTTLEGGIGCRLSTWSDPDVNAAIPFYHRLAELHRSTRELPRSRALPRLIHIIDVAVQRAITTGDPSTEILRDAQASATFIL